MAGTYFDGDTTGAQYQWTATPNLSASILSVSVTGANPAAVGDLIAGSWSAQESATPVDILDTSGSVGGVTASFQTVLQGAGKGPSATPSPSSDFLPGQPASFTHDTLGTINGTILSSTPESSTVGIDQDTPLSRLNVNMTMPVYSDGSIFYSWQLRSPGGTRALLSIRDIAVDASGNIWATGWGSGGNASMLFDRFGNYIRGVNHTFAGLAIELNSNGELYVMGSTQVERFDASGTSLGVIITSAAGTFAKMTIGNNNNVWLATTDTTGGRAIKRYSGSGAFISQSGNYSPSTIPPTGTSYNQYTGISWGGPNNLIILVGNTASDGAGNTLYYYNTIDENTGTIIGPFLAGKTNAEFANLNMDWTPAHSGSGTTKTLFFSQSGLYNTSNRSMNTSLLATPGVFSAFAADSLGSGYWATVGSTVYRIAGGYMGINQCIECYLGAAGYRGKITWAANTSYAQTNSDFANFPAWEGNVWSKLKELAARGQRTITTDGTGIVVARNDTRVDEVAINIANRIDPPQVTEGETGAQVLEVTSQNVSTPANGWGLLYSADPFDSTLTVDVAGVSRTTIQANVYATNIDPPVAVNSAFPTASVASRYGVVDSSNPPLRVDAALWTARGGNLDAFPSTTTLGAIDLILRGPTDMAGYTGPFSVGYIAGSDKRMALNLTGYGITINPQTFPVYTGAPLIPGTEPDSQSLESVFLNTMSVSYDMARMSAPSLAHGEMSCTVSIPVSDILVPFGKIAGSYFYWKRNYWRVYDVKVSGGLADLSATRDTRVSDVQDGSLTHGQIDGIWAGFRYKDNYLSPGILGA